MKHFESYIIAAPGSWVGRFIQFSTTVIIAAFLSYIEANGDLQSGRWTKTFTVDRELDASLTATVVPAFVTCAAHCGRQEGCRSFGFQSETQWCLLYDHLVEYTMNGTHTPSTRYYWLLSPRCPSELGYSMQNGVCLKTVDVWVSWDAAQNLCAQDGGHLLVAHSPSELDYIISLNVSNVWLGATDRDQEGDWRWVDGQTVGAYGWQADQPDNVNNATCLYLAENFMLDDDICAQRHQPLCQIPAEA